MALPGCHILEEEEMRSFGINKFGLAAVFAMGLFFAGSVETFAQGNSQWAHEKNRIRKEQKQFEKAEKKAAKNGYRVYRNEGYYDTDYRGIHTLRDAVNVGYQQGHRSGRMDRQYRLMENYEYSPVYRQGVYGYQDHVDREEYQHYFRQGFERGYYDGYRNDIRYGYQQSNTMNILGSVLNAILNFTSLQ
jgi:hypothetical protein